MKIKLWMTQDECNPDYQFWIERPTMLRSDGSWVETLFSDPPAFLKCDESDVPEHLRFPPGCKTAIRRVAIDITFSGIEEDAP